jgi:DNA mismatch repair protein MutS
MLDDAKTAAGLLNLTLTARNGTPMCGIPQQPPKVTSVSSQHRQKVAICDQLEEAKPG